MSSIKTMAIVVISILFSTAVFSQDKPAFTTTKLNDHIYELAIDGGGYTVKVLASIGDDGLLLLESGQKETVDALKEALKSLGNDKPQIIISSHEHVEHIGGNEAFGRDPVIIGHSKLRTRLRSGSYLFDEFPESMLPDITFTDSLSIYFNGEEIKLLAFTGSHSDNDIVVWFTESKIVFVGALSNGFHFPSVDGVSGDVLQYPDVVGDLIDILPEDVTIIPGHGEDCTMEEYRTFHAMLVGTRDAVREGYEEGRDLESLQKDDILSQWSSFEGGYVDKNQWIKYNYEALDQTTSKKKIYEPIYYALRDKGIDGAMELYTDLKSNYADEYELDERAVIFIAYKLFKNGKMRESIRFFETGVKEYPDGDYTALGYYYIGKGYYELGDKKSAVKNLNKALEVDPETTQAKELLEEIEGS